MANKSNLNVVIDNGGGIVLSVICDSSGYLVLVIDDGKNPLKLALNSSDANVLRQAIEYSTRLRQAIPQS